MERHKYIELIFTSIKLHSFRKDSVVIEFISTSYYTYNKYNFHVILSISLYSSTVLSYISLQHFYGLIISYELFTSFYAHDCIIYRVKQN